MKHLVIVLCIAIGFAATGVSAVKREPPERVTRELAAVSMPATDDFAGVGTIIRQRVTGAVANSISLRWLILDHSSLATVNPNIWIEPVGDGVTGWVIGNRGRAVVSDRSQVDQFATGALHALYQYDAPNAFQVRLSISSGIGSRLKENGQYTDGIAIVKSPWYNDSLPTTRTTMFRDILGSLASASPSVFGKTPYSPNSRGSIPLSIFLDSSFATRYPTTWRARLQELLNVTSACFEQQFDAHFELTKVINVRMAHSSSISVDAAFNALVANRYPGGDTISVLLYSDSTINPNDPIGETEFGRKQIALHETEYENRDDIRGWAIVQALALLHELGHSFGAIHVSDAYSVMNHSPSPVGSFTFDTVNATIIRGALAYTFGFEEQTKYLQTVTHTLRTTGYRLADYPSFFQNYVPPLQTAEYAANVQRVVNDDQLVQSAIGLRMLNQGDSAAAIAIFDGLSKADSTMAALLYYRALATRDIETSNAYLYRAADMGYYLAQELLHVRMKQ